MSESVEEHTRLSQPNLSGRNGEFAVMMHHRAAPALSPRVDAFDNPMHGQDHEPCADSRSWLRCLLGSMQRPSRAITWLTNDFDTNMVGLLNVMSTFPAIHTVV